MDYRKQEIFFKKAYDLGEKRIVAGYGWPVEVDPQVVKFFNYIKKNLPKGKMLDLGCGQGRHALFFAEQRFESWGIDYINRALEEAKEQAKARRLKNAHFQTMDLLKLNFSKNTFDVVLDWSVLDHIYPTEWKSYLSNVLKVLKMDGYLMLVEFSAKDSRIKDKSKNFAWDKNSYDHYL